MTLTHSDKHPEAAVYRHEIPAGEPFLCEVKAGQTLRLLDLEGNREEHHPGGIGVSQPDGPMVLQLLKAHGGTIRARRPQNGIWIPARPPYTWVSDMNIPLNDANSVSPSGSATSTPASTLPPYMVSMSP